MKNTIFTTAAALAGHACKLRARHTDAYVDGWVTQSGYGHFLKGNVPCVIEPHLVETHDPIALMLSRTMVAERLVEAFTHPSEVVSKTQWKSNTPNNLSCIVVSTCGTERLKTSFAVVFEDGTAHKTHVQTFLLETTKVAEHE